MIELLKDLLASSDFWVGVLFSSALWLGIGVGYHLVA